MVAVMWLGNLEAIIRGVDGEDIQIDKDPPAEM
jgi:hypothetical protein